MNAPFDIFDPRWLPLAEAVANEIRYDSRAEAVDVMTIWTAMQQMGFKIEPPEEGHGIQDEAQPPGQARSGKRRGR